MSRPGADEEIGPFLRAVLLTAAHQPSPRLGADDDDRLKRSGLVSSQIMGLALMRYVWLVEPVATMSDYDVVWAIGPNLQHFIEGDLGENQPPRRLDDQTSP